MYNNTTAAWPAAPVTTKPSSHGNATSSKPNYVTDETSTLRYRNITTFKPNYLNATTQRPRYTNAATHKPSYVNATTPRPGLVNATTQKPGHRHTDSTTTLPEHSTSSNQGDTSGDDSNSMTTEIPQRPPHVSNAPMPMDTPHNWDARIGGETTAQDWMTTSTYDRTEQSSAPGEHDCPLKNKTTQLDCSPEDCAGYNELIRAVCCKKCPDMNAHIQNNNSQPNWITPVLYSLGGLVVIMLVIIVCVIKRHIRHKTKRKTKERERRMDELARRAQPPKAPPRPASSLIYSDVRRPSAEYSYIHPDDVILMAKPRQGNDPLPQTPGEYLDLCEADNYAYLPDCDVPDIIPTTADTDMKPSIADPQRESTIDLGNHAYQNTNIPPPYDVYQDRKVSKDRGKEVETTAGTVNGQGQPDGMRKQNSYGPFPVKHQLSQL